MKIIQAIVICTLIIPNLSAQSYMTAAGIRLGGGIGLSVQQLVSKKVTVEAQLRSDFARDLTDLAILGERHHAILVRNINFYVGGGFYKGWYNDSAETNNKNPFGVSFIAGIELTVAPLVISLDFRPDINLVGSGSGFQSHSALSLRHVFIKKKKKKINLNFLKFWENW